MAILADAALAAKMGGGEPLLKGSSLPLKTQQVKIKVLDVRDAPEGFASLYILDIEPCCECKAMPLNKTNVRALKGMIGNDFDVLKGKTLVVDKYLTRNPKTGSAAWGLMIVAVEEPAKQEKKK